MYWYQLLKHWSSDNPTPTYTQEKPKIDSRQGQVYYAAYLQYNLLIIRLSKWSPTNLHSLSPVLNVSNAEAHTLGRWEGHYNA